MHKATGLGYNKHIAVTRREYEADRGIKRDEEKKNTQGRCVCFWFEAFWLNSRKSGSTKRGRGREAATPDRTYSSPPFSLCAPFCTAPWVWLSGPGPHPRPQKWDLARPCLHRGNKTRPRGCWGTALVEARAAWQGRCRAETSLLRLVLPRRFPKPPREKTRWASFL